MNSDTKVLPRWRKLLFGSGTTVCVFAAIGAVCCWRNPFSLIHLANGGFSINPLDEYLFKASLYASALAVFLGVFGRGGARVLLIAIAILLLALSVIGYTANHV